jgi:hypothetical protein
MRLAMSGPKKAFPLRLDPALYAALERAAAADLRSSERRDRSAAARGPGPARDQGGAGVDTASAISIDKSTFTRLGTCEGPGGCAHSIYIGDYGSLSVTRSRFEAGRGGHYVKSRSRQVAVIGCSFDDTAGRETNYMIDLPGGSSGRIANNWFVQGQSKENYSAFITVAPEGRQYSSAGLVVEGNDARFAPGVSRSSTFVANWTDDPVRIGVNRLAPGIKQRDRR